MNASFKAAIDRLAAAMAIESKKPAPDWADFCRHAFRDLNASQRLAVIHSNDMTFQNALKRAAVQKMST